MPLSVANVRMDVPSTRLEETVAFWAAALGAEPCEGSDGTIRLDGASAALGVHLGPADADADADTALELVADDTASEVARLRAIGAQVDGSGPDGETLRDPAGRPLRVVAPPATPGTLSPADPVRVHVDAVVLDVPAELEAVVAAFWAAALEVEPFRRTTPSSPYLWSDELRSTHAPFDLGVQALGDRSPARLHVDSITTDVAGEVARLLEAGATLVAELPRWTVVADPVGTLLCVVDASGPPVA